MTTPIAPSITPERWRLIDTILQAALANPLDRRNAFIRDACGDDDALRREVVSLLAAHDGMTESFLERAAVAIPVTPTPVPAPDDLPPSALVDALAGRYALESMIARGGMATVYQAHDLRHGRNVAIKVLRDEIAAAVGAERFLEEIRVTALLQHPHILPLFDSGSAGRLLWYVMPLVDGETLRSRLAREGPFPVDDAVRIAREVADALGHAHKQGIIHRDIKPENVLLQDGHAVVADFGIALALEHAAGERLTKTGLTLGTPQYMAPEQAAADRAIDARADIYALGAVLYEMLLGEAPFVAESRQALLLRILREPPATLATRRGDVPAALDSAIRQALAKRPEERFPSAAAFAAALAASSDGGPPIAATVLQAKLRDALPAPRTVTPQAAILWAAAALVMGLLGGWSLGRMSMAAGWTGNSGLAGQPNMSLDAARAALVVGKDQPLGDGLSLVLVDRSGHPERRIGATRPWTPRFSPDGRQLAYGAFGPGRTSSDIWVTDLDAGTTRRITDDDKDSNDPQWSADGKALAYSVSAPGGKDIATHVLADGAIRLLPAQPGSQFTSDWVHDGSALIVTDDGRGNAHDILIQPLDGSAPWPYLSTPADELAARVSPDGHWIAYMSNVSGRPEVYLDSYPRAGNRVAVSRGGGADPVWRADGRELYYWRNGQLIAVELGVPLGTAPPAIGRESILFDAPYQGGLNTMYDVAPDGRRFAIVEHR